MCVCSTTSSSPRANVTRRCFPFDSTERTRLPTTSKRAASELIRGATTSNPVTTLPASARRSTFATRWIVSPSGIPFHVATRGARETGRTEWLRQRGLVDRKAVDLVEEERGAALGARLAGERELRRATSGDEVPATDPTRVLHRFEHPVHGGESAGEAFRLHGLARHDAVPLEQLVHSRGDTLGRRQVGHAQRIDERPAASALL